MNSKVWVASLILLAHLSTAQGAVIPSEVGQVFQKVQDVLVNAETFGPALGMRVKRDTGDWDKELDMEPLGLTFKIKYVDPSNPFLGGHAYLKFPGHRFVKAANFDDVELKVDFKGSIDHFNMKPKYGHNETLTLTVNMKIEYKFIEKLRLFPDQPQEGVIRMSALTKSDRRKSNLKMSLERNGTKEFEINADGEINVGGIKLHGQVSFEHNNVWEMFIDLNLSSKSINIRFIQNGLEYSVAANAFAVFEPSWLLPSHLLKVGIQIVYPGHRHSFQVEYSLFYEPNLFLVKIAGDFHGPFGFETYLRQIGDKKSKKNQGKFWLYNGDKTYALIDLVENVRKVNDFRVVKYVATYSFMDGWPQFKTQGSANINYNVYKKFLKIDYTELNGTKGNINIEIERQNSGLKYLTHITHDSTKILKQEGVLNILNRDSGVWEVTNVVKTEADETSTFYKFHCYYIYPVPCTTSIQTTRKFSGHRHTHFTYKEETLHGVEKFSTLNINTTRTLVGWDAYNTTYTYKQGGKTFWEGQHDFLIHKTRPSLKFNTYSKIAVDENSLIYAKLCGEDYPVNCSNVYEFEERFYIDSRNTTMDLHLEVKKDGENIHLLKIDAMKNLDKLELNGNKIGDYKISDNQLTATYQPPGGEKTNLQLESEVSISNLNPKYKSSLKIETPASTFNLDVDFNVTSVDFNVTNVTNVMHIHGENLKYGKYDFLRKADWSLSNTKVVIAWDGKLQFEKGPMAIYSPTETKAHMDYDVTGMVLTGNIQKDIAGKKWSFQVTNNKGILSSQ